MRKRNSPKSRGRRFPPGSIDKLWKEGVDGFIRLNRTYPGVGDEIRRMPHKTLEAMWSDTYLRVGTAFAMLYPWLHLTHEQKGWIEYQATTLSLVAFFEGMLAERDLGPLRRRKKKV